jgi:hypothetical protein
MKPVPPAEAYGGSPVVFAKDQPEYRQLPARTDAECVITTWQLTAVERVAILAGAPVVLQVMTFGGPLQPVSIYVEGCEAEMEDG